MINTTNQKGMGIIMKYIKNKLTILFLICCFMSMFVLPAHIARAATDILPTVADNLTISLRSKSELVATSDGYMRVFYDGKKIGIEYYDNNFNIKSKKSLAMELPYWGGFYTGSDA